MAWVSTQAAARKPGKSEADVLNRLRLNRVLQQPKAAAGAGASSRSGSGAPKNQAFQTPTLKKAPPLRGTTAAASSAAGAGTTPAVGSSAPAGAGESSSAARAGLGPDGLPPWAAVGSLLMYRSKTGHRFRVVVKEVTSECVKIIFKHQPSTWKNITREQVLASSGPLRPLTPQELKVAAAAAHGRTAQELQALAAGEPIQPAAGPRPREEGLAAGPRPRSRSRGGLRAVQVLDDNSGDEVEVLDD